ncbi:MAG: DNA primase DnaG [Candidatus Diapherotrites archaeon]|nr:DNA primase DnaG [Candidatus Diapherotrites archaeon]
MAKTYISSAKYKIVANFEVSGIVDKHDVVGAVFGQSEGLLGASMDLKELQQSGKIGRIEIEPNIVNGKTTGKLIVPSSIDSVQTSMLAAAIESVDKVGPYDAKFETENIEDTRAEKRGKITDRAKELLTRFMKEQTPDVTELREDIADSVRTAQLVEFGPDKLPAGPDVEKSAEIILVEGRADVINLLKNGITNAIAMDGAKVPPTILELAKTKKILAFLDGDRGGDMNARNLLELAGITNVVRAPDGKEVEELTKKEILQALKKETEIDRAFPQRPRNDYTPQPVSARRSEMRPRRDGRMGDRMGGRESTGRREPFGPDRRNTNSTDGRRGQFGSDRSNDSRRGPDRRFDSRARPSRFAYGNRGGFNRGPEPAYDMPPGTFAGDQGATPVSTAPRATQGAPMRFTSLQTMSQPTIHNPQTREQYKPAISELKGTLSARLLDEKDGLVGQTSIKELLPKLKKTSGVSKIVFDGIITKRLVDAASKAGVKTLVGIKLGKIEDPKGMELIEIKE